jgi:hypothetical protein
MEHANARRGKFTDKLLSPRTAGAILSGDAFTV